MKHELQIRARPHYLTTKTQYIGNVAPGATLAEIVQIVHKRGNVSAKMRCGAIVQVNGEIIPPAMWLEMRPASSANVIVTVGLRGGGGGGKNPLAMILTLAVIVAAPYLAGAAFTSLGFATMGPTGLLFSSSMAASAFGFAVPFVAAVSMMAVNALFPTRPQSLTNSSQQTYKDSPTYSISGARNTANKFGTVPVILGRHKVVPPLGAQPYTELSGNDEYLRMLFIWGYGPLKIEDIKIGDTPISEYEDIEIETREGRPDDAPITLIPAQVVQESIGVTLKAIDGWITRRSKADVDELSVDIAFPSGLVEYSASDGGRLSRSVTVEVEYQRVGDAAWSQAVSFAVTDTFVGNLRKGHRWVVSRGEYDVRLRRLTEDTDSDRIRDDVAWYVLRSITNETPVNFPKPLAMTAIRIRASEQLQGMIDYLNGIVTSYAPAWNGIAWEGQEATQNPAALMRLTLTHPANARPRKESQLDDDSFGAFYEFCASNGYAFNMVRDYQTSVWDACADICSAARAAPSFIDGRWGAIMDKAEKPIVQHFTPRTSWGFTGEKVFTDLPHAFRVTFNDEDNLSSQTKCNTMLRCCHYGKNIQTVLAGRTMRACRSA